MSIMRKLAVVLIFGSAGRFLIDRFHLAFEAMFVTGIFLAIWDGVLTYRHAKSPVQTLFTDSSAGMLPAGIDRPSLTPAKREC